MIAEMDPAGSSFVFSLGGLLFGLLVAALALGGISLTGFLLWLVATSAYKNLAAVRWAVDRIWDITVYSPRLGDAKECVDALKTRLAAIEKLTWFYLTLTAAGFIAGMNSGPTLKFATLDIPPNMFCRAFFVAYLSSTLYYVKLLASVHRIYVIAPNKPDIMMHLAVNSGFLSPFSESSSLTGWLSDLLGFSLLIFQALGHKPPAFSR